jgi:hypothetical protein
MAQVNDLAFDWLGRANGAGSSGQRACAACEVLEDQAIPNVNASWRPHRKVVS